MRGTPGSGIVHAGRSTDARLRGGAPFPPGFTGSAVTYGKDRDSGSCWQRVLLSPFSRAPGPTVLCPVGPRVDSSWKMQPHAPEARRVACSGSNVCVVTFLEVVILFLSLFYFQNNIKTRSKPKISKLHRLTFRKNSLSDVFSIRPSSKARPREEKTRIKGSQEANVRERPGCKGNESLGTIKSQAALKTSGISHFKGCRDIWKVLDAG